MADSLTPSHSERTKPFQVQPTGFLKQTEYRECPVVPTATLWTTGFHGEQIHAQALVGRKMFP
jgi:hypothetical protein